MDLIKVVEPRSNVKADVEKNHIVYVGGDRITHTVNNADSWDNAITNASWSVTPPSDKSIIDRNVMVRSYIEVQGDVDFAPSLTQSLRQLPLNSIVDVTQVQINGETVSEVSGSTLHAMMCYGNTPEVRTKSLSKTAQMPDSYQDLRDYTLYGSAANPMAAYGETRYEPSRGGFPSEQINSNTYRFEVTEPLFISPFHQYGPADEGMVNVNSLRVALRFKSDIDRVMTQDSSSPVTTFTVRFYQAPELLINYITPAITQPVPELQILPYHQTQHYIKQIGTVNAGVDKTVISDTIRLSVIPETIYLFCAHSEQSKGPGIADAFLAIDNVRVTWGNQAGLLSSCSKQQLYDMAQENGCNLDYPQFTEYRGSVLALKMGKDICLNADEAPGCNGSYNIQVQMTVRNPNVDPGDYTFYMCVVNPGTFSIGSNSARASIGNLTGPMVLSARDSQAELPHHETFYGGSFWGSLKKFVHKAAGVASKLAVPVASALGAPELGMAVQQGAKLAQKLTRGGRLSRG